MKLIVISPSKKTHAEMPVLLQMFDQGLRTYHIRKPGFSTKEMRDFLKDIPQKFHSRIVLHTHHMLAKDFKVKGIYLSRKHKKRKLRTMLRMMYLKFRNRNLQVATGYRSLEDLYYPKSGLDYVLLSPVFDSLEGKFHAGFTEFNLRSALKQTQYRVMARGGVSVERIQKASDMGFAGVVLSSAIWKSGEPIKSFLQIKDKLKELGQPLE